MNESIDFDILSEALVKAGAGAVAAIRAEAVGEGDRKEFGEWTGEGRNAGMEYMVNWPELRFDPRKLHEGTRWIVCCAFPYAQNLPEASHIASYALGEDYHKVIPKRIREALRSLGNGFGETARICVDSAPVREKYWAVRSGLGRRCQNGLISVPGLGTQVFLAEILTPWEIEGVPSLKLRGLSKKADAGDKSGAFEQNCFARKESFSTGALKAALLTADACQGCGACRRACPGGAIREDGTVDARRCVSYLTIEHKGDWDEEGRGVMERSGARGRLFGCEICQRVCPLNREVPTSEIEEFRPRPELLALTPERVAALTEEDFHNLTRNSPIRRTGLDSLRRNAGMKSK